MTLAQIDARSADLVAPVRARLAYFCAEPTAHVRFLNMLSLMEHIGSRKIMTSQTRGTLGANVLKHLAEEARHAFFFKRQAEKVARRPLDYAATNTMAVGAAKMYLGRLDAGINRVLGAVSQPEVPYLYASMIIEVRAVWGYGLYQAVLSEERSGLSLKSLMAEEELHLPQMTERLLALGEDLHARVPVLAAIEDGLFRRLWRAIEADATVH